MFTPLREMAGSSAGPSGELAEIELEIRTAKGDWDRHIPHPPSTGRVLEIGSGQSPHVHATIVVDKYPADDFERPGDQQMNFARPFVVGDGQALPFADGIFDYVIALHVLEHAEDPAAFAAEMVRVGERGFVQVPSRESELVFGWPYHGWLIDKEGEGLVFESKGDTAPVVGDLFHRSYATSPSFRAWFNATRSTWHHSIEWRHALEVRVKGEPNRGRTAQFDLESTVRLLRRLGESGGVRGPDPEQSTWLRCPVCRGALAGRKESTVCTGCAREYPVVASVPILVAEAAR